jgi:CheY-like chemotaxis protein
MKYSRVPVCYFPTSVIFVDDSKRFLTNTSYKLDESLAYLLFDNPERALDYINKENKPNILLSKYLKANAESSTFSPDQRSLNFDVKAIYKESYNPERFNLVSVVVVDYSMPVISGVEFCRQLQDSPVKIIMVTGEADQRLAVELFNEGLIDKFILKSDPNFEQHLNSSIKDLQTKFFQEVTEQIASALAAEPYCLNDSSFIQLFEKIIKQYKIVEYYLLDEPGSYLLLDINGNSRWLILNTIEDIKMYYEFAKDSDVPAALLSELKANKKIGYAYDIAKIHTIQGESWKNYLYPAQELKPNYYYSLVEQLTDAKLDAAKILSYEDYLDNEWPPV